MPTLGGQPVLLAFREISVRLVRLFSVELALEESVKFQKRLA